jgi:hypothetical protein
MSSVPSVHLIFQLKKRKGCSALWQAQYNARFFREAWEQSGQGFLKNEHPSAPLALIKRLGFERARKKAEHYLSN